MGEGVAEGASGKTCAEKCLDSGERPQLLRRVTAMSAKGSGACEEVAHAPGREGSGAVCEAGVVVREAGDMVGHGPGAS